MDEHLRYSAFQSQHACAKYVRIYLKLYSLLRFKFQERRSVSPEFEPLKWRRLKKQPRAERGRRL